MRIRTIEAIPLRIGFRQVFRFGTVDRKVSQNVIIAVTTTDGIIGYGEACPVSAFSAETQQSVVAAIERVRPLLVGQDPLAVQLLVRALEKHLVGFPFALSAIDIALWDVAGKALGVPVSTLLGGRFRERIDIHGSVGWGDSDVMAETAGTQGANGDPTLKLYAGRDTLDADLRRVAAVRNAVGPDVQLMLDINGLWSMSTCLEALPVLREHGVVLLEQPIDASDELGQAEIVQASSIDIAADEAVFGPVDVARIGRLRTATVINLGLSKLGGILRARECEIVARANGLDLTIGSVLELGIATAAGLHLASAVEHLAYPSYLVGPLKYEQEIAWPRLTVHDGQVDVPVGPGLGIEVDVELLAALDLRTS